MSEGKTLGAKQVATRIGTDAKTFRKFLRQVGSGVGQGRRYDFPEADVPELKRQFDKWLAASKAPKTKEPEKPAVQQMKLKGAGATLTIAPADDEDEIDDLELDPSDEELTEIDDELDDLELDDMDNEEEED